MVDRKELARTSGRRPRCLRRPRRGGGHRIHENQLRRHERIGTVSIGGLRTVKTARWYSRGEGQRSE